MKVTRVTSDVADNFRYEEIDAVLADVNAARPGYICVGNNTAKFAPFADCFAAALLADNEE